MISRWRMNYIVLDSLGSACMPSILAVMALSNMADVFSFQFLGLWGDTKLVWFFYFFIDMYQFFFSFDYYENQDNSRVGSEGMVTSNPGGTPTAAGPGQLRGTACSQSSHG